MNVLDASALLALLNDEPGAKVVSKYIESGVLISSVNYAEVAGKLCDYGMPEGEVREVLEDLDLLVEPFSEAQALTSGALRKETRQARLSLGDRACLALARHAKAAAVTADHHWEGLTDIPLELIR